MALVQVEISDKKVLMSKKSVFIGRGDRSATFSLLLFRKLNCLVLMRQILQTRILLYTWLVS